VLGRIRARGFMRTADSEVRLAAGSSLCEIRSRGGGSDAWLGLSAREGLDARRDSCAH
jgi:hypothetical protein